MKISTISLLILLMTGCKNYTIIEDKSVSQIPENKISRYTTWGDVPFWIDSAEFYSIEKMNFLDLKKVWIADSLNLHTLIHQISKTTSSFDIKQKYGNRIHAVYRKRNIQEFNIHLKDVAVICENQDLSKMSIGSFKTQFPQTYNWRNLGFTGYIVNLDYQNDSVYDDLTFRVEQQNRIIFHLVNGHPRTLTVEYRK